MYRLVLATAVVLLALPLQSRFAEASGSPPSSASEESRNHQDTCDDQVKKTPEKNPYNIQYPCLFLNMLYNFSTCASCQVPATGGSAPSAQDIIDLQVWINVTASAILEGAGGSINESTICDLIYSFKMFLSVHVSIEASVSYQSLYDATGTYWGSVSKFNQLDVFFQYELIESTEATSTSIISLDSNDECALMKAINAAGSASGNETIEVACYNLTVSIQKMLMIQGQYNLTQQLSFIFELVMEAEGDCPGLLDFLFANCQIEGFGSFMSLISVSKTISATISMQFYMNIEGHTPSTVPILGDLVAIVNSCTYGQVQCGTLNQLLGQINVTISDTTIVDITIRLKKVANQIYQMCLAAPWICSVKLPGCDCTLGDIVLYYSFCSNEDLCELCMDSPPPTLPPDSGSGESGSGETDATGGLSGETDATGGVSGETTVSLAESEGTTSAELSGETESAETTEAASVQPTTTQPTTKMATTSPSKCVSRSILLKQSGCGCSGFYDSAWKAYASWSLSIKLSFNASSTGANFKNAIFDDVAYPTPFDKINKLVAVAKSWLYYNSTLSVTTLYYSDGITIWGNFGDFVKCGDCVSTQCNP